ncbi:hypothetical protein NKR23_g11390 [Pleurostoma richardsiae]|uniref:Uncharacterized protein n=1 Tax=Pleurostoma richardsiae TaxID=41990 RepID=A0AA38VDJ6_9PEZI|nr:hypothetical protein NKR23_g11390 [Pleurostoma richardsiae]
MSTARDPTSRLRAGLNPLLTTSLNVYPQQSNTPLSAVSYASTSHNGFSSTQTPVSAIQPYNPQAWISSPIAGPDRPVGLSPDSQASPPPPPPYSPPRSQRPASTACQPVIPAATGHRRKGFLS